MTATKVDPTWMVWLLRMHCLTANRHGDPVLYYEMNARFPGPAHGRRGELGVRTSLQSRKICSW